MRTLTTLVLIGIAAAVAIGSERSCTPQERLTGRPTFIDGDSFEIGNTGVRLFGVDAPEGRQSCTRDGRDWSCGDAAGDELRRLVGSRDVTCEERDRDTYGRIVAVCRVGTTDLGAAMVRAGMATAYRRYSNDYVDEENEARGARRGIWAGDFTPPEDWRRAIPEERREDSAEPQSRGTTPTNARCAIKGNVNGDGERIYHTPGSSSYESTVIDTSRGERWFCSEAEAKREGWRAPRG